MSNPFPTRGQTPWDVVLKTYIDAGDVSNTGAQGPQGTPGSTWLAGSGIPSNVTGGVDGDYYLRTSNGEVYKKISGIWTDQGYSIQGPQGESGSGQSSIVVTQSTDPTPVTTDYPQGTLWIKKAA